MKNILIIGSGGREHALGWKISQSPKCGKLYFAPGNGGTAELGENIAIPATDLEGITKFALDNKIDLVVVAPDDPLAMGLVDKLKGSGIRAWGPTKGAAQIEASKAFAKKFMADFNIPTAEFKVFANYEKAANYVESKGAPIVVKASGLALGKGAVVCKTLEQAKTALKEIMIDKIFGEAGNEVVVEEFLEGPEVSIHAFCDGKNYQFLPAAQDHKPIGEGDTGLNTGGMGTIAPVPWVTPEMMAEIEEKIVRPTVSGLSQMDHPFVGLLYPGLKITPQGPKVLEYNARFGDPETQSYMRLLKTDLVEIMEASIDGRLQDLNIEFEDKFACTVVVASGGYPEKYEKGFAITGIEEAEKLPGVVVFHAGTKLLFPSPPARGGEQEGVGVPVTNGGSSPPPLNKGGSKGGLVTSGGRVLGVSAVGSTLREALDTAYKAARLISFHGMYYRKDIGASALRIYE